MTKRNDESDSSRDREERRRRANVNRYLRQAREACEQANRELIKFEALRELSGR